MYTQSEMDHNVLVKQNFLFYLFGFVQLLWLVVVVVIFAVRLFISFIVYFMCCALFGFFTLVSFIFDFDVDRLLDFSNEKKQLNNAAHNIHAYMCVFFSLHTL